MSRALWGPRCCVISSLVLSQVRTTHLGAGTNFSRPEPGVRRKGAIPVMFGLQKDENAQDHEHGVPSATDSLAL